MVNLAKTTTDTLRNSTGIPPGLGNGYPGSAAMAAGVNTGGLFTSAGGSSASKSAVSDRVTFR